MVDLSINENRFTVLEKERTGNAILLEVNGKALRIETRMIPGRGTSTILVRVGSRLFLCRPTEGSSQEGVGVWVNDRLLQIGLRVSQKMRGDSKSILESEGPITLEAPMAGRIVEVRAVEGMRTTEGQALVVLEAMKMENEISSPRDGHVREVHVKEGSLVRAGEKLVVID